MVVRFISLALIAVAAASCSPAKTVVLDRLQLAAQDGNDQVTVSELLMRKDGWLCFYSFTTALPETEREAAIFEAMRKSFPGLDNDEYIYIAYPALDGTTTIERSHYYSTTIRFDDVPDKACATIYAAIGLSHKDGLTHVSVRW